MRRSAESLLRPSRRSAAKTEAVWFARDGLRLTEPHSRREARPRSTHHASDIIEFLSFLSMI